MSDLDQSAKPMGRPLRVAVYTCTFSDYDILLSPCRSTPGCDFIAFLDKPQPRAEGWSFRRLPAEVSELPQNEANRFCKLFPMRILPDYDVSIYIDGNILVGADLTPLIREFVVSEADLALFPGQGNRTVAEEIELTLQREKVRPDRQEAARRQLADLRAKGEADLPITMNGVLFRRHENPDLEPLMQAWWEDINTYAMRDQYGLPGLLRASPVKVHYWNWQYFYAANSYFSVRPHRAGAMSAWAEFVHASKARGQFLQPEKTIWSSIRALRRGYTGFRRTLGQVWRLFRA